MAQIIRYVYPKRRLKNPSNAAHDLDEKENSAKRLSKIAGTLQHPSMGIPGGKGLFTAIRAAMKSCKQGWIKLTPDLKAILADFKWLFRDIATKLPQVLRCMQIRSWRSVDPTRGR